MTRAHPIPGCRIKPRQVKIPQGYMPWWWAGDLGCETLRAAAVRRSQVEAALMRIRPLTWLAAQKMEAATELVLGPAGIIPADDWIRCYTTAHPAFLPENEETEEWYAAYRIKIRRYVRERAKAMELHLIRHRRMLPDYDMIYRRLATRPGRIEELKAKE